MVPLGDPDLDAPAYAPIELCDPTNAMRALAMAPRELSGAEISLEIVRASPRR